VNKPEDVVDVLIVGGGITGLSAAWALHREGDVRWALLEAEPEPGGSLATVRRDDGFLVDHGANSTLDKLGLVAQIAHDAGFGDRLIEANKAAQRRYIVKDGALRALPGSPLQFLTNRVFSVRGKLRLMLEPVYRRARHEETIAEFVRRRLGPEFLDWAIDPFVSGVYAGDPARLSVRAATAKIYALEREYGSLLIGAVARLAQRRPSGPMPRGRLVSFRGGIQEFAHALQARLGASVCTGARVTALTREPDGTWAAHWSGGSVRAKQVLLALPAYAAAALLRNQDSVLARLLEDITYAAVASVALGYRRDQVTHPLDGFGVLIPSRVGVQTLGALFSSTLFPGRAPDDHVLLTSFIGGARNAQATAMPPEALSAQVARELGPLLGLRGEPVMSSVRIWKRAIPQYEIGHLQRLARIEERLGALPGLGLIGSWRDGIAASDCVANGYAAGRDLTVAGRD
jgi:oxygen-dependent protoporphyrinogen oxidase